MSCGSARTDAPQVVDALPRAGDEEEDGDEGAKLQRDDDSGHDVRTAAVRRDGALHRHAAQQAQEAAEALAALQRLGVAACACAVERREQSDGSSHARATAGRWRASKTKTSTGHRPHLGRWPSSRCPQSCQTERSRYRRRPRAPLAARLLLLAPQRAVPQRGGAGPRPRRGARLPPQQGPRPAQRRPPLAPRALPAPVLPLRIAGRSRAAATWALQPAGRARPGPK